MFISASFWLFSILFTCHVHAIVTTAPYNLAGKNIILTVNPNRLNALPQNVGYALAVTSVSPTTPSILPSCPVAILNLATANVYGTTYFGLKRYELIPKTPLAAGMYYAWLVSMQTLALGTPPLHSQACGGSYLIAAENGVPFLIYSSDVPQSGGAGYAVQMKSGERMLNERNDLNYFSVHGAQPVSSPVMYEFRSLISYYTPDQCMPSPFGRLNGLGTTLEAWFYAPSVTNQVDQKRGCCWDILSIIGTKTGDILRIAIVDQGKLLMSSNAFDGDCDDESKTRIGLGFSLLDDKWHHVAFVVDLATRSRYYYLDGELVFTQMNCKYRSGKTQLIDADAIVLGDNLEGYLDEVRAWTMPRTVQQIRSTMFRTLRQDEYKDLLFYYDFDNLWTNWGTAFQPAPVMQQVEGQQYNVLVEDMSGNGFTLRAGHNSRDWDAAHNRLNPMFVPSQAPVVGNAVQINSFVQLPEVPVPTYMYQSARTQSQVTLQAYSEPSFISSTPSDLSDFYSKTRLNVIGIELLSLPNPNIAILQLNGEQITKIQTFSTRSASIWHEEPISDVTMIQRLSVVSTSTSPAISLFTFRPRYLVNGVDTPGPTATAYIDVRRNRPPLASNAGGALFCDGDTDYALSSDFLLRAKTVTDSQNNKITGLGALTIEFWVKFYGSTRGGQLVSIGNSEVSGEWCTGNHCNGRFTISIDGSYDASVDWNGRLSYDANALMSMWHHVAFVSDGVDGNNQQLYLDGILVSSNRIKDFAKADMRELSICHWPYYSDVWHYYKGWVDEFRIWNKSLTLDEILEVANKKLSGTEKNLVVYYDFDQVRLNFTEADPVPYTSIDVKSDPYTDVYIVDKSTNKWDLLLGGCTPAKQPYCAEGSACNPNGYPLRPCIILDNGTMVAQGTQAPFIVTDQRPGMRSMLKHRPNLVPSYAPLGTSQNRIITVSNNVTLITLTGCDPDYDPIRFFIYKAPVRGSIKDAITGETLKDGSLVSMNQVLYSTSMNEGGYLYDTFQYATEDGLLASKVPATVLIDALCDPGYFLNSQTSKCTLCPFGSFQAVASFNTSCVLCPKNTYQPDSGAFNCIPVAPLEYTLEEGATAALSCAETDYPLDQCGGKQLSMSKTQQYSITVLLGISSVIIGLLLILVLVTRSHRVMHASSPFFGYLFLLGLSSCIAATFLIASPKSVTTCQNIPLLLSLGYTLSMGSVFLKTYRIKRIFMNEKMEKISLPNNRLGPLLLPFLFFDVLLIRLWHAYEPFLPISVLQPECTSGGHQVFATTLILVKVAASLYGAYLAFLVRKVPILYNESISILWTTNNVAIVGTMLILFNYVLDSVMQPGVRQFMTCLLLFYGITSAALIMYVPKIRHLISMTLFKSGTHSEFRKMASAYSMNNLTSNKDSAASQALLENADQIVSTNDADELQARYDALAETIVAAKTDVEKRQQRIMTDEKILNQLYLEIQFQAEVNGIHAGRKK